MNCGAQAAISRAVAQGGLGGVRKRLSNQGCGRCSRQTPSGRHPTETERQHTQRCQRDDSRFGDRRRGQVYVVEIDLKIRRALHVVQIDQTDTEILSKRRVRGADID